MAQAKSQYFAPNFTLNRDPYACSIFLLTFCFPGQPCNSSYCPTGRLVVLGKDFLVSLLSELLLLTIFRTQCGRLEYNGTTYYQQDYTCVIITYYYSQCQPPTALSVQCNLQLDSNAYCLKTSAEVGGSTATIAVLSITSSVHYTTFLSTTTPTATHTQASYPAATPGSC